MENIDILLEKLKPECQKEIRKSFDILKEKCEDIRDSDIPWETRVSFIEFLVMATNYRNAFSEDDFLKELDKEEQALNGACYLNEYALGEGMEKDIVNSLDILPKDLLDGLAVLMLCENL
jgi:hypothetical protein